MLYVEIPSGVGFSYSDTVDDYQVCMYRNVFGVSSCCAWRYKVELLSGVSVFPPHAV